MEELREMVNNNNRNLFLNKLSHYCSVVPKYGYDMGYHTIV